MTLCCRQDRYPYESSDPFVTVGNPDVEWYSELDRYPYESSDPFDRYPHESSDPFDPSHPFDVLGFLIMWKLVVPGEWAGEGNEDREQWEGSIGNVPFDCMTCICQVESNCSITNPICRGDGPSESCGFYQIKENYWTDGGAIGESWKACAAERQCSEDTIQGYMNRYATEARLKHKPTCEDFSRIHYGGPTGYKRASTLEYWNKVNECLAN